MLSNINSMPLGGARIERNSSIRQILMSNPRTHATFFPVFYQEMGPTDSTQVRCKSHNADALSTRERRHSWKLLHPPAATTQSAAIQKTKQRKLRLARERRAELSFVPQRKLFFIQPSGSPENPTRSRNARDHYGLIGVNVHSGFRDEYRTLFAASLAVTAPVRAPGPKASPSDCAASAPIRMNNPRQSSPGMPPAEHLWD